MTTLPPSFVSFPQTAATRVQINLPLRQTTGPGDLLSGRLKADQSTTEKPARPASYDGPAFRHSHQHRPSRPLHFLLRSPVAMDTVRCRCSCSVNKMLHAFHLINRCRPLLVLLFPAQSKAANILDATHSKMGFFHLT